MNILAKIGNVVKKYQKDIFLGFCIVLISTISFNLGRINALNKTPLKITGEANVYQATVGNSVLSSKKTVPVQPKDLRVVASKASTTKKYHFTWCPGAKQIKETNKLWFVDESLAQKAGYTLASNCQ
jgi:hypothetical protein